MFGGRSSAVQFRQVALVHVSLTVLLTLFINAPTSAPILRAIGFTKLSATRVHMLQLSQDLLNKRVRHVLTAMSRGHPIHGDVSWSGIQRLVDFNAMVNTILGQSKQVFDAAK